LKDWNWSTPGKLRAHSPKCHFASKGHNQVLLPEPTTANLTEAHFAIRNGCFVTQGLGDMGSFAISAWKAWW
jgi:hypothetical protein